MFICRMSKTDAVVVMILLIESVFMSILYLYNKIQALQLTLMKTSREKFNIIR